MFFGYRVRIDQPDGFERGNRKPAQDGVAHVLEASLQPLYQKPTSRQALEMDHDLAEHLAGLPAAPGSRSSSERATSVSIIGDRLFAILARLSRMLRIEEPYEPKSVLPLKQLHQVQLGPVGPVVAPQVTGRPPRLRQSSQSSTTCRRLLDRDVDAFFRRELAYRCRSVRLR